MQCAEAESLIDPYEDGELDPVRSLEVERHMGTCVECARTHRELRLLREAIRFAAPYYRAGPALERRVVASIPAPRRNVWTGKPAAWLALAATVVLATALYKLKTPELDTPVARDPVVAELLNSHVRSLMAEHLVDVPSSDRHTVRPWFTGKLDFSPEVNDYADKGFPLAGGRLDYVAGRPVAALVYRRNLHVVNLYVWPPRPGDAKGQAKPVVASFDGYNFEHWNAEAMNYWAVSDLNPAELAGFARMVRGH